MVSTLLASLGLLLVLAITLHWVLDAALRQGRRLPGGLRAVHAALSRVPEWLAPSSPAARRRAAWERSHPQHDDDDDDDDAPGARRSAPPVEWDGNVARPRFGAGKRPQNLH